MIPEKEAMMPIRGIACNIVEGPKQSYSANLLNRTVQEIRQH